MLECVLCIVLLLWKERRQQLFSLLFQTYHLCGHVIDCTYIKCLFFSSTDVKMQQLADNIIFGFF